jgi:hypothetical protein
VLLSAFLFPGTLQSMTSGRVTRAWAAWHHPRWFREVTDDGAEPATEASTEPSTEEGTATEEDVAPAARPDADPQPDDGGAGPTP